MQLIEAALAFAITMLALSLVVSSFVEIIHRICSMREEGLKHVLRQMFDQVIKKHLTEEKRLELVNQSRPAGQPQIASAEEALKILRDAFVARMSANRAPMGAGPRATATNQAENAGSEQGWLDRWKSRLAHPRKSLVHFWEHSVRLWNGRDLAAMTPAEFMERLGSSEVGHAIAKANIDAEKAAKEAGATAAEAANVVLKHVAQKFEAFGKEASVYFEGRARLLSVVVAMALAFLAHVDAVDLFKTYLRDPNARAKVIEQSAAVTAQHKAAMEAAIALKAIDPNATLTPDEVKKEIEALKNDWKEAIVKANSTVKQYADVGLPLGWTDERWEQAKWHKVGWLFFKVPTIPSVWFYLFLGGLLIGLGAPFWYDAVVGLTNISNAARGTKSADAQTRAAAGAGTTQPVTPVDAFRVSHAAQL